LFTANVRTLNSEDRPWSQQNGSHSAFNLYYVEDEDITQGIIAFLNLAVVCSFSTLEIAHTILLTVFSYFFVKDSNSSGQTDFGGI